MRVAVLGAGASGVATARNLLASHQVVLYDSNDQLGGTWVYSQHVGQRDGRPVYTSMYRSLRTNLPKEVMAFPDFPFPDVERSYLPSCEVLAYLNAYADHFGIRQYIKFRHHVELVRPKGAAWEVTTKDLDSGRTTTREFDAVAVCTGHYWKPNLPSLEGASVFCGSQLHVHDYRTPDRYSGRRVLVLGAGPSGVDVALELSTVASKVVLSHHLTESLSHLFPENVTEKPDVDLLTEGTAHFKDGTATDVDDILYCTGYVYSFPFLSEECRIEVSDVGVRGLFQHVLHIPRPTLAFIGLPFNICPFALFDMQAKLFSAVLDGRCSLPDEQSMREDAEREWQSRLSAGHKPHFMGEMQDDYLQRVAALVGVPSLPPAVIQLYEAVKYNLYKDLRDFRNWRYRIVDDHTFERLQ